MLKSHISHQRTLVSDANDTYVFFAVDDLESLCDSYAEDDQMALIKRINLDYEIRCSGGSAQNAVAYLLLFVTTGAPADGHTDTGETNTYVLETALDAAIANEYMVKVLAKGPLMPKNGDADLVPTYYNLRCKCSYQIPKKAYTKGLFQTQEASADSPPGSHIGILISGEMSTNTYHINGITTLDYILKTRTIDNIMV